MTPSEIAGAKLALRASIRDACDRLCDKIDELTDKQERLTTALRRIADADPDDKLTSAQIAEEALRKAKE